MKISVSYTHLPELSYDIHNIGNTIIERLKKGKPYSIVVVAEGIKTMAVSYTHLDPASAKARRYYYIKTNRYFSIMEVRG